MRPRKWTCGHTATAMCAQCYQDLARRSNALAAATEKVVRADRIITAMAPYIGKMALSADILRDLNEHWVELGK